MDGNRKPILTTNSQPGMNLSSGGQIRGLSETLAHLKLNVTQQQQPILKAVEGYFQHLAQQTQSEHSEPPKKTESVTQVQSPDKLALSYFQRLAQQKQTQHSEPQTKLTKTENVTQEQGQRPAGAASSTTRTPPAYDRRGRPFQSFPNNAGASVGFTNFGPFNLDTSGTNPNYVVPNTDVPDSSRRGTIRSVAECMGSHVCEDDYLEHLVQVRRVAEEAKKFQPEDESWD